MVIPLPVPSSVLKICMPANVIRVKIDATKNEVLVGSAARKSKRLKFADNQRPILQQPCLRLKSPKSPVIPNYH